MVSPNREMPVRPPALPRTPPQIAPVVPVVARPCGRSRWIGPIIGASVFLGSAVLVGSAYMDWSRRMDDVASKARDYDAELVKGLAEIGALSRGEEVKAWIEAQVKTGAVPATRRQLLPVYLGAAKTMPEASEKERRHLTTIGAQMIPLMGAAGAAEYIARLGRLRRVLPDKSLEQVAGVECVFRQRFGEKATNIGTTEFMEAVSPLIGAEGVSGEAVLGLAAACLEKDIPISALEALAAKVMAPMTPRMPHSAQDVARNRFARAGPKDRLEMLLSDPKIQEAVAGQ